VATEHAPPPVVRDANLRHADKVSGLLAAPQKVELPGQAQRPEVIRNILVSDKFGLKLFPTSTSPVKMSSMILWHPFLTLMADAMQVIEMRLRLIALGKGTSDEMFLIVSEKIEAFDKAQAILIRGGDPAQVLDNYRKMVAANVARLSG
jgi:hypothetical protein